MSNLHITGGRPLEGTIRISGRKNAALKLIAAALLSDKPVTLHNVPEIADVMVMLTILESLGARIERNGSSVTITAESVGNVIPTEVGKKLRASLVCVGPLLGRHKHAEFPHPGGCVIGKRSISAHLEAFQDLGATIAFDGNIYTISAENLAGKPIYLKERSVTGTENLIMAAVRAEGTTTVYNAAEETHIVNLCDLLRAMGFSIQGDGTSTVVVHGQPGLATVPAEATIIPDEIEVGTYVAAAAVTRGNIRLEGVGTRTQLMPILAKMDDFNIQYTYDEETQVIQVTQSHYLKATDIQTNPWPGFPPDLQSPFTVIATQAKGTSLVHDWMYEGRLYFVDLLQKMGANIVICDPHRALVSGPTRLQRSTMIAPDLRAGAALVIAALAAEGTSTIEHVELVDRGYEKIEEKLRSLGAQIERED